jgi:hypothetical protein
MCGGGGGRVQDNSAQVAQIQAQDAEKARQAQAAEQLRQEQLAATQRAEAQAAEDRKRNEFATRLNSAYQTAINDASAYFASMGLDPAQYQGVIKQFADNKKGAIPDLDSAPGSYFDGIGKTVYSQEEEAARSKAQRAIDSYGSQGFDKSLISDNSDDAFINSLLEENYGESSKKIDNQKKRGVLTGSGYEAALKELSRQKSGARSNLDAIGTSILETGRGTIRNKVADARSRADSFKLGSNFDPYSYQKDINNDVTTFFSELGDKLRGAAPDDLFDISSAFSKGGIAQGAQNTNYDADASAGIFALFDEEAKKKKQPEQQSLSPF